MEEYLFRKAAAEDIDAVSSIYDRAIDADIRDSEKKGSITGWRKGIYPVRKTAEDALKRDDLFVCVRAEDGQVVATGIINQKQVDVYAGGNWVNIVPDDQVMVLHTLVVDPDCAAHGIGRRFLQFYEDYARDHGCTELRIDTNITNNIAHHFYNKIGYRDAGVAPTTFNGLPGVNLLMLEKGLG